MVGVVPCIPFRSWSVVVRVAFTDIVVSTGGLLGGSMGTNGPNKAVRDEMDGGGSFTTGEFGS
jgi:hypothetical protein